MSYSRRQFLTLLSAVFTSHTALARQLQLDDFISDHPIDLERDLYSQYLALLQLHQLRMQKRGRAIGYYPDQAAQEAIQQIARPLWSVSTRSDLPWRVILTDSKLINAFTVGGGLLVIHYGLLQLCDNESQLASVIAHEIGHVEHRHSTRRLIAEHAIKNFQLESVLSNLRHGKSREQSIEQLAGLTFQVLQRAFTRQFEHEADAFVIKAFLQTGYPLKNSTQLYHKLLQQSAPQYGLCLFDTHPAMQQRIQRLKMLSAQHRQQAVQTSDSDAFQHLKALTPPPNFSHK